MYNLICMSFDGDYVKEGSFDTIEECWERSNNMGSRWFFFPFHFVVSKNMKIISDSFHGADFLKRKRLSTVQKMFVKLSLMEENKDCNVDDFVFQLQEMNS